MRRTKGKLNASADYELDFGFFGGDMCTNNSGERVAIGDGDCRVTECGGLNGEFVGVAGTGEECEVGGDVKFGV